MIFKDFKKAIQDRLAFLEKESVSLFVTEVGNEEMWQHFLASFEEGTNEVYRVQREHDCNRCKSFIRQYGNIVGIIDGKTVSIWSVDASAPYKVVAESMAALIESAPIKDKFFPEEQELGTDYNYDVNRPQHPRYEHFYCKVKNFVPKGAAASKMAEVRQTRDVIARSFEELMPSAIDDVLSLIEEKTLYRGEEHQKVLVQFKALQRTWITSKHKHNYTWEVAVKHGRVAAIRNTAIGTLLVDLSEGMDMEVAISRYEKVVAPANYKRPNAVFTKSMREAAQKTVAELGLTDSLGRRHAHLTDVSVADVLWASGESKKVMVNPFDLLQPTEKPARVNTDNLQEVGIEHFIENILPGAQKVEVLLENAHTTNLMNIIAPIDKESPSMFKWNNGFSWAYNNDVTDSIKEKVKTRGGDVSGILRFSIMWAEGDPSDNSDLDAHCQFPNNHLYYGNKVLPQYGAALDVDIRHPREMQNKDIVENITFSSMSKMPVGEYIFSVHNFACRGTQKGFTAEIEAAGQLFKFFYNTPVRDRGNVVVAKVMFDGTRFTVIPQIPSEETSKDVWGLPTKKFATVSSIMYSPNYWGDNAVGNKHYFFMLEGLQNTDTPRGFFNEFLRNDLTPHRKVFEALSNLMRVEHDANQLAGIGFSSTVPNSFTVRVDNKPFKINITNERVTETSSAKSAVSNRKGTA